MGRRGYPAEFRRRVLDLPTAGRKAVDLSRDFGVSEQTIYTWRRQERIDRGLIAGLTPVERDELATAKRRIRELEAELEIHRRAVGRHAVELLMRRAGLGGLSGRPRFRRIPHVATAGDLVERVFAAAAPNRLWLTDIVRREALSTVR
jgi:transposase-like protein